MNPFFFGNAREPLFGVYSPPASAGSRENAVLICPPLGREYIRSHWALRRVADQLAGTNTHVLRFDYFGTGDSAGESQQGDVTRWRDDIRAAAEELVELSGVRKPAVLGLRAGAALAATTVGLETTSFVLWDPILSGQEYLCQLQDLHQCKLETYNRNRRRSVLETPEELLGFPMSPAMRESIEQLDVPNEFSIKADRIRVFHSSEANGSERLLAALEKEHREFSAEVIEDAGEWDQVARVGDAFLPGPILSAVVNALKG